MPNKLITAAIATAALTLCGQSFAQYPAGEPSSGSPGMSPPDATEQPNKPADRVQPQAGDSADTGSHKSHKSGAKKKPKSSKKSTGSGSDSMSPATGGDAPSPSQ